MNQSILNRPRNDKFTLVMDIPKALKDKSDSILQKKFNADQIQFTVFGSPVPALEVPSIDVPYGSQTLKVSSYSRSPYPTLNLKFLIDSGYQNYWILWAWLNLFNDQENSTSPITKYAGRQLDNTINLKNYIDDYITTFTLYGLDEYDNRIISFQYKDAFITKLGSIDFNHQSASIIIGNADFAYNQLNVELLDNINNSNC